MDCKRCSACSIEKALEEFYKDSNPRNKTGRQSRCIVCAKAQAIAYHKARPEWKREKDKRYAKRHPDKVRERAARRRKESAEYWREYARQYRAAWRIANPEKEAATAKRYRENNAATVAERYVSYIRAKNRKLPFAERDKMRLVYAKAKQYGMEVDHVVPLKHNLVCGLHVWHNLQLLAVDENRRKRNLHWPEMP